jgi:hypothetical protein
VLPFDWTPVFGWFQSGNGLFPQSPARLACARAMAGRLRQSAVLFVRRRISMPPRNLLISLILLKMLISELET